MALPRRRDGFGGCSTCLVEPAHCNRICPVDMFRKLLAGPYFVWALLSLPAIPMVAGLASAGATPESLLHPTGEFAARFMIAAMAVSPLRTVFPRAGWLRWLSAQRRALGLAAFGYAVLHTALYVIDMATLRNIFVEFLELGIWTGWAAFALFLPLAVTSNDAALRALGRRWPALHRVVYAAAALTLVHWIFVHNNTGPALAHFAPLACLAAWRLMHIARARRPAAIR